MGRGRGQAGARRMAVLVVAAWVLHHPAPVHNPPFVDYEE